MQNTRNYLNMAQTGEAYIKSIEDKVKKWNLPNGVNYSNSRPVDVHKVAVIGGGTMGRGIAISAINGGFSTVVVETDDRAIQRCRSELEKIYARLLKQQRITEVQAEQIRSVLSFSTNLQACSDADLVIEAIFENLKMKQDLFQKLERICKVTTVFGTNTSSIDINKLCVAVSEPSRVVGIHYFNPAHLLTVVEVVYGEHTSGTAVASAFHVCHRMKKHAVLVRTCRSFVFNRMMNYQLAQANRLVDEFHFKPQTVDVLVGKKFGLKPGPFALLDIIGLDLIADIAKEASENTSGGITERLQQLKRYGRKTGRGWYRYLADGTKVVDEEVEKWIDELPHNQITGHMGPKNDQEILEFLFYPFVNEGLRTVDEGIVPDISYVDILWLYGGGWPRAHGGPMKWAEAEGWGKIYEYMQRQYREYGCPETLKPSRLLEQFARISSKY